MIGGAGGGPGGPGGQVPCALHVRIMIIIIIIQIIIELFVKETKGGQGAGPLCPAGSDYDNHYYYYSDYY